MKMKFRNLIAVAAVFTAASFLTATARADSFPVAFSVWANGTGGAISSDGSNGSTNVTTLGTPGITGTVSNSTASPLNFNQVAWYQQQENLTAFLQYGNGNNVTYLTGSNQTGNYAINGDVMNFTGETYLQNGATYTITHDDGVLFNVGGNWITLTPPNSGGNTSAGGPYSPSSFMWQESNGLYNFSLWYDEVAGLPATLNAPALAVTPEPPSLLLLGTGLLGLAFLLFRRKIVKPVSHATLSA